MKTYAYGHDFGNAEIGGVLLKGKEVMARSIPTAFSKMDIGAMRNMGVSTTENALIIQMQDEQTSYGIGEIALAQAVDSWNGRGDMDRYASRYSLRGLLAVSASLIPDKEYGLLVVTGLPAETYQKNSGLRKQIKKALEGSFTFTIDQKTWRTAHIEVATVVMEGAGALIAYGNSAQESAQGSAVIDVGGRTTDLYVARGQVPVIDFCKGKPIGVESATQMMMRAFENKYDFPLSQLEARKIMHAYTTPGKKKAYPALSVFGEPIPAVEIEKLVSEAVTQTAEELVSFVASAWRQSDSTSKVAARFSPVLNIGGGVFYFFEELKKRIPHLTHPDDPVHANGRGYAQAAARALAKKNAKATETTA